MALQITLLSSAGETKSMRVDHLDLEVLEAIAEADPKAEGFWHEISLNPFANAFRTYAVLDAVADALKLDHVEHNLSPKALDELLEIVDDIEQMPMQEGFPQEPSETEAGSTSTSLGLPTTGRRVWSEPSLSESS